MNFFSCLCRCLLTYFFIRSWLRTDLSPNAGMTNVIADIPTGYIISRDTIEWMYSAGFPGLRRVRFYEQQLITFFEYVSLICWITLTITLWNIAAYIILLLIQKKIIRNFHLVCFIIFEKLSMFISLSWTSLHYKNRFHQIEHVSILSLTVGTRLQTPQSHISYKFVNMQRLVRKEFCIKYYFYDGTSLVKIFESLFLYWN